MIARLLCVLLLAAAPAPRRLPAAVPTIAPDAADRWIPFDLTPGNQIRFVTRLDGRAVTAVLDTGVSVSVLSRRYAAANALPVSDEGQADVVGGTVPVWRVAIRALTLGGVAWNGGSLRVATLPAAATGGGAIDLLLGRDLTAPFALDIDYAQRRFRLLPSGRMPFVGTSAPLAIASGRQVYVSTATLGGALLQPMVIDTGDGAAITLGRRAWLAARLAPAAQTTTISYGVGGAVVSDMSVVPSVIVGRSTARDVEVRVEPAGGFSDIIGVAGRVGSGFLQNYRVLLDPGAGHMLLAPAAPGALPPQRSTSGLLLGAEGPRARVLHVMRGSPAAAAGWRDGEAICAVDGTAITAGYPTDPLAGWTAGRPGRRVALTMCDGTRRALLLRAFY